MHSVLHWAWFTAKFSTLTERFRCTSDTVFDTFPWPQFGSAARRDISVASKTKKHQSSVGATSSADAAPDGAVVADALSASQPSRPSRDDLEKIRAVTETAVALRVLRRETMAKNGWSLRELDKTLEIPGTNKLRDAQAALDTAVRAAYGMKPDEDILAFLLKLNLELVAKETKGDPITPPGLPAFVAEPEDFISQDCVAI